MLAAGRRIERSSLKSPRRLSEVIWATYSWRDSANAGEEQADSGAASDFDYLPLPEMGLATTFLYFDISDGEQSISPISTSGGSK